MTENEAKAIKWMKNVRDDAVVTLDHIEKNEPNVSPMLYAGRKEKAEAIIKGFEELEQYRSIGTVSECREAREKQRAKKPRREYLKSLPNCPNCGEVNLQKENEYGNVIENYSHCPDCGQAISWEEN